MKKIVKYLLLILIIAGAGAYIYWNQHKKNIIKQTLENALKKKTDSLYYLHYDSSRIDEINGNVHFYKVALQSDSAQQAMLRDADSLPSAIFNIKVDEVSATGIDVAGLLQKQNVTAKQIELIRPFIHIINTGTDKPRTYSSEDTMELYKHILGRFKSITADSIIIKNGTVVITNRKGKALTTLENTNIGLGHFIVDSTHNYDNIVSYFIKDVRATVENIQLPESPHNTRVNVEKIDYDAAAKTLKIGGIQQYKTSNSKPVIDLKNITFKGLSTSSFILQQQFSAESLSCNGGLITIYTKGENGEKKTGSGQFSTELFDAMQVGSIQLGNSKVIFINSSAPEKAPLVLNDVRFNVTGPLRINEDSNINNIISNAQWQLQCSGFSVLTKDGQYKISVSDIRINNATAEAAIGKLLVTPLLSEDAFMKRRSVQGDRYDLKFNNVRLQQMDFKKLLAENKVEIGAVSLQPQLYIYNDRTLPYDTSSKVGKYPNQALQRLGIHIYIKKLNVVNGSIVYKERGHVSEQTGTVQFDKVNATLSNITNIAERIQANSILNVQADANFLNSAALKTKWELPLNAGNASFNVSGQMGTMPAPNLNGVTQALGMTTVKDGTINSLNFNFTGNDYNSTGKTVFLYKDLHVEVLKKGASGELKEKELTSFFANLLIKNNNPQNGDLREGNIAFKRDITKSFFNFLWKSVFDGVKHTAQGK